MNFKFKFWLHQNYWWISILFVVAMFLLFVFKIMKTELLFYTLGTILTSTYFVQKQKLQEAKLFKELFDDFNNRYDNINDELDAIYQKTEGGITPEEKNLLVQYFNLCAEEYVFSKKGYIYPDVWKSWKKGMEHYYKDQLIQKLWEEESKQGSYYGFTNHPKIYK